MRFPLKYFGFPRVEVLWRNILFSVGVEGSPRQKAYLIMALCWFRFANYQANEKKKVETSSPARFLALDKDRESRFAIRLIRPPKKGTVGVERSPRQQA